MAVNSSSPTTAEGTNADSRWQVLVRNDANAQADFDVYAVCTTADVAGP